MDLARELPDAGTYYRHAMARVKHATSTREGLAMNGIFLAEKVRR